MRDQKALFETGSSYYHHLLKTVHVRQASPPRASFLHTFVVMWLALAPRSPAHWGSRGRLRKEEAPDSLGFMAAASLFGLKGMGASGASPNTSGSLARNQTRARMTQQFLNLNRSTINIVICLKTKTHKIASSHFVT